MKTFSEFMVECSQLEESSLSRIKSKSDKSGIAALSADRGDSSRKENQVTFQKRIQSWLVLKLVCLLTYQRR